MASAQPATASKVAQGKAKPSSSMSSSTGSAAGCDQDWWSSETKELWTQTCESPSISGHQRNAQNGSVPSQLEGSAPLAQESLRERAAAENCLAKGGAPCDNHTSSNLEEGPPNIEHQTIIQSIGSEAKRNTAATSDTPNNEEARREGGCEEEGRFAAAQGHTRRQTKGTHQSQIGPQHSA